MLNFKEVEDFLKDNEHLLEDYGMILTHIGIVRATSKKEPDKKVKALIVDYNEEDLENLKKELKQKYPNNLIFIKIFKGKRKVKDPIMIVSVGAKYRQEAFRLLKYIIETLKTKILKEIEIFG